jgi:hypothetical protein
MPSDTGQGTESYTWNTNAEWNNGTFTDTQADSDDLRLSDLVSLDFDYELTTFTSSGSNNSDASVEIRNANTNTLLASDSVSGDTDTTGTFTIDTSANPDLEFTVSASTDLGGSASASVSEAPTGETKASVSIGESTSDSDTATDNYDFERSGSWVSDDYTFTEATTATKLSWSGVSLNGGSVDVTVRTSGQTDTTTVALTGGSGESLISINPDSVYDLSVSIDSGDDYETTPTVGSLSLETHTQATGLSITDTRSTEVDFSWSGVSVSDGYEIYYKTSSGVTDTDTLGFDTTNSGTTTGTVTGLDQGTTYHFNVRAQYSGE